MTLTLPSTIYVKRPTIIELLTFLSIIVVATALRLGAPGIVEFKRDEANLSYMSLDMARGKEFPLLGIDSSVGIRNAPVNVWIMALPFVFSSDPVPATQFVALLNVIAVALVYVVARRYYGILAAVIAGVSFAVAPWSIIYARKIWAQDMLPLFVVATVFTGLIGFVEGKRWGQWLHLPLLAITGQIHYVTFVLIPITLYLLFVGRRRLTRAFFFSIMVAILVTLPYAIGAIRESILKPETLVRIISRESNSNDEADREPAEGITLTGAAGEYAWFTIAGTNLHSITGEDQFLKFLPQVEGSYTLFNLFGVVIAAAICWLIVRSISRRDERTPIDVALLLWLLVTPIVFSITWTPVFPHYMIPIFPAAYLILGAGISDLVRHSTGRTALVLRSVCLTALVFVAFWHVRATVDLHTFLSSTVTSGGFGTPLGNLSPIRAHILAQEPTRLLARLDGQYVGYHEDTTVWNFLLYDIPDRRFLDDATDVYPAEAVPFLSHDCRLDTENFYLRTHEEGCYTLTTRSIADFNAAAFTPIPAAMQRQFTNGATITAYRWEREQGCLTVVWNTDQGPLSQDYSMAVHLVNVNGEKILDADGLSYRGQYWRAGDTVTRRFCIQYGQERLSEITGARLNFYTSTETSDGRRFDNVPLLDEAGNPETRMIEISFS